MREALDVEVEEDVEVPVLELVLVEDPVEEALFVADDVDVDDEDDEPELDDVDVDVAVEEGGHDMTTDLMVWLPESVYKIHARRKKVCACTTIRVFKNTVRTKSAL